MDFSESDGTKSKCRAATLGKKLSDEHRAKIRAANLGKKLSDETKSKMRAAHVGKVGIPDRAKTYDIILLAPDGAQHGPITNLSAFAREHGLYQGAMHDVITGKRKSHRGWRLFVSAEQT